jgi:hypothetical protein
LLSVELRLEFSRSLVKIGLRRIQLTKDNLVGTPQLQLRAAAARDHHARCVAASPELALFVVQLAPRLL